MRQHAVLGCGELVTLQGPARARFGDELRELAIIRDGAFTFRDGRIERTGTRAEIEPSLHPDCDIIDAAGHVVLPGFVDAHTHAVFAGTRAGELEMHAAGLTYEQIAQNGGGIRYTVQLTRAATENHLIENALRYARWFLRCGATTVEAKSGYGLTVADELKILRAIRALPAQTRLRYVPTFLGAHIVPDEYRGQRESYVDLVINGMLPAIASEKLAEYCDVFCDRGAFTPDESARILTAARTAGLKLRIHADQLAPGRGAQVAAHVGATTADHLEYTGAPGIAALKHAGIQPVLLPGAVFALGLSRYPAARAMIDAGLAIVLATDFNPGSSPTPSIPMVLSIAVRHMGITPAEAVTAATINAAHSLDRGSELGSLEPGKRADFVIHDCHDYRELAYFFGIETALATYINGDCVFRR